MTNKSVFTYQTRLYLAPDQEAALDAYAELHGKVERCLFAAMKKEHTITDLKKQFIRKFEITARQFNALRVGIEGKIQSIKELRPEYIQEKKAKIAKTQKVIKKLEKDPSASFKLHQKKRKLSKLQHRLKQMEADEASGHVRLCFGSRELFRKQFNLKENKYASLADWKKDWKKARSRQFFVLGSKDEVSGCQGCQARIQDDGKFTLVLRLPNALSEFGKTLCLSGIHFPYGHDKMLEALSTSRRIPAKTKKGVNIIKRTGSALSYRFLRDEKGWRVFVSTEVAGKDTSSRKELGAIGVDVNADHLAVAETDRFGNLIKSWVIPLPVHGKSDDQKKALIGEAAKSLVTHAAQQQKPVVVEKLDFRRKKADLDSLSPRQARMLSSFCYRKVLSSVFSASLRAGVDVIEVNPAYTSVIGAVNHAQTRGISIHQGAAYAIARRGLRLSERPSVRSGIAPSRNGGHVTFALPVRNRAKHVWSFWASVRKSLKAAHEAHYRSGQHAERPSPLVSFTQSVCSHRSLKGEFLHANRSQHCSGDVPW